MNKKQNTNEGIRDAVVGTMASIRGKRQLGKMQRQMISSLKEYIAKHGEKPNKNGNWREVLCDWIELIQPDMYHEAEFKTQFNSMFGDKNIFLRKGPKKLFLKDGQALKGIFMKLFKMMEKYDIRHAESETNNTISTSKSSDVSGNFVNAVKGNPDILKALLGDESLKAEIMKMLKVG